MPPLSKTLSLPCPGQPDAMCTLALRCPDQPSNDGAYKISWTLSRGDEALAGKTFVLQENGKKLYDGADEATSVSGRQAGQYSYRVGVVDGGTVARWTDACTVQVEPPSLGAALSVFGVGLFVFLATVVLVLVGHRRHARERDARAARPAQARQSAAEDDA